MCRFGARRKMPEQCAVVKEAWSLAPSANTQDDGVESGACKPGKPHNKLQSIIQSPADYEHCDVHSNARRVEFVAPSSIMAGTGRGCARVFIMCD